MLGSLKKLVVICIVTLIVGLFVWQYNLHLLYSGINMVTSGTANCGYERRCVLTCPFGTITIDSRPTNQGLTQPYLPEFPNTRYCNSYIYQLFIDLNPNK